MQSHYWGLDAADYIRANAFVHQKEELLLMLSGIVLSPGISFEAMWPTYRALFLLDLERHEDKDFELASKQKIAK